MNKTSFSRNTGSTACLKGMSGSQWRAIGRGWKYTARMLTRSVIAYCWTMREGSSLKASTLFFYWKKGAPTAMRAPGSIGFTCDSSVCDDSSSEDACESRDCAQKTDITWRYPRRRVRHPAKVSSQRCTPRGNRILCSSRGYI
jgi:hypothetical protein